MKMTEPENMFSRHKFKVASFYSFINLDNEEISLLIQSISSNAIDNNLMGTVLLASEGINGSICGSEEAVKAFFEILDQSLFLDSSKIKYSWTNRQAFKRFKVRRKSEIVTMGVKGVNPRKNVGKYIQPSDWNDYLNDPETLVIDTRNKYEIGIGSFEGAVNPFTRNFREFPSWVDSSLTTLVQENNPKRIAMFCTGGIRCEKATSYLKMKGFKGVHHLQGGILRYLEEVPLQESLWKGECFVFDQRVALTRDLIPGEHMLCYACGMPLNNHERTHVSYVRGVQCHHCEEIFSDQDRVRFAERQRQFDKRDKNSLEKTFR